MSSPQDSGVVRSTAASGSAVYESTRAVHEYLLLHFGDPEVLMPYSFGPKDALNFPVRSAEICRRYLMSDNNSIRALDLGISKYL